MADVPKGASAAVLQPSEPVPENAISVQGPNFDNSLSLHQFLAAYERVGFQATSLGKAIDIVNRMVGVVGSTANNLLLSSFREDGGYPMNRLPRTNQKNTPHLPSVQRPAAISSLAILQTSSHRASAKLFYISSSIDTLLR